MLTLTAPGENAHDRLDPKVGGAFATSRHRQAVPSWRHVSTARPACDCGLPPGGLEEWNPSAGARWNVLRTNLRRNHELEFFKVNEVQDRGALHLHVLLRSQTPLDVMEIHALALSAGFGCSMDLAQMPAARAARYVAKYAAKGYTGRPEVPWKDYVLDKGTGEMRVRQTAAYRTVSQSHRWGLTLRQIKDSIRASLVAARAAALDPLEPVPAPVAATPALAGAPPT
jgi:hypothetical protein